MKKLSFWFLLPVLLFFSSGCYTQLVTYETEIAIPDSATVNVTNNYEVDLYSGYDYTSLNWSNGYQPYWYDGFYTPWYNPYRAYIYPWRPFIHKPIWRFPFHYTPPRHGNNWGIVKPTNPPKHGKDIGRPNGPVKESVRDAIIRRTPASIRYTPQRVQLPASRVPQVRDTGQRNTFAPVPRGNERNYPISQPAVSQPQQHNAAPPPAQNSGGSRSSGATRTGNR